MLAASALLAACGTSATVRATPRGYAQSVDSATSTCSRNPACYTRPPGEQAVLPWLSRAADAASATVTALRLLEAAELARARAIIEQCAKDADFEVDERELGEGKRPTRQQCKEVVGKDARGNPVTRAMELGRMKHEVALRCVQENLGKLFPENFTVEPRYHYDDRTGRVRLIEPRQVEEWLSDGLAALLIGTLVPDVVIHASGNPLKVQAVYEFKFPCPITNSPSWRDYPPDHPNQSDNQGQLYRDALGVEPHFVTPPLGSF